jgi:transcriptional regulator of acetoin/glycerol metabolism
LCEDARSALVAHDWPGNILELRNVLQRAVILTDGDIIEVRHVSLRSRPCTDAQPVRQTLSDMERSAIERALHEAAGNKTKAARRLGLTRTQLYGRLRRYGLEDSPSVGALP